MGPSKRCGVRGYVLAAMLPLALAACVADAGEDETDTTTQDVILRGSCTIRRPYGWSVQYYCAEAPGVPSPLYLAPGRSTTFRSYPYAGMGQGYVTVTCHSNGDGLWDETAKICTRPLAQ